MQEQTKMHKFIWEKQEGMCGSVAIPGSAILLNISKPSQQFLLLFLPERHAAFLLIQWKEEDGIYNRHCLPAILSSKRQRKDGMT